jgi:hypothetical protein
MKNKCLRLPKNNKAVSPAISTIILTAGVVVMILVVMTYSNTFLNTGLAQNEFNSNKQFMSTAGLQMDQVAWTIGRAQTVSYSSKFGSIAIQPLALTYTFAVHTTTSGWQNLSAPIETGIVLYNMPISVFSMGNNYFERVPMGSTSAFLQSGSSAPVSQVFCEEKLPMTGGSFNRIVVIPTLRVLNTTVTGTQGATYFKFYLPVLENGTSPYRSQSLTLTGDGITKMSWSSVDQVVITASFPKAASGFDPTFFRFQSTTITLNSTSNPKLPSNSVVELYVGKVLVTIGLV